MNPHISAIRAGLARGRIEFRHNIGQMFNYVVFPMIALVAIYVFTTTTSGISLGVRAIPGILAANLVFTGLMGLAITLIMERADGTLLRAKATPNGVLGYLIGKVVSHATISIATLFIVLVPAGFLFDGLRVHTVTSWATLSWVLALGMLATLPFGAILGSLFTNPRNIRFMTLVLMGLMVISGVFYPLTVLPQWIQWLGQAFPLYWLGLGMRSAMLPDALVGEEIAASWRHVETVGVLGLWAVVGLAVAPVVLRRMARRQSGTRLRARGRPARQPTSAAT